MIKNDNDFKNLLKIANKYIELHKYKKKISISNSYSKILDSDVFSRLEVSDMLYMIKDESYSNIVNNLKYCNDSNILNVFSGSGRLIKEMINSYSDINHCTIYNLDISQKMIDNINKRFSRNTNIHNVCSDILLFKSDKRFDYIICHCGLRYLCIDDYIKLLNKILYVSNQKGTCIITETNIIFIKKFIELLKKRNIDYNLESNISFLHKNTSLYICFLLYLQNGEFTEGVNRLALKYLCDYKNILIILSDYKYDYMHTLSFRI